MHTLAQHSFVQRYKQQSMSNRLPGMVGKLEQVNLVEYMLTIYSNCYWQLINIHSLVQFIYLNWIQTTQYPCLLAIACLDKSSNTYTSFLA